MLKESIPEKTIAKIMNLSEDFVHQLAKSEPMSDIPNNYSIGTTVNTAATV